MVTTRWPRTLAALLLAASALVQVQGCGSEQTLELFPQIDVTIDAQPSKTLHEFAADTTGGQLTSEAVVRIRNSGRGDLVLSEVAFVSQNKYIKDAWPAGKPTFPKSLKEGEILTIKVQFKPDPNDEDNGGAIMTIKHNDKKVPNDIVLSFKIKLQGPKIALDQTQMVFVNPSKAAPPTQCVTFGNAGNAPLVFKKAYLGTASPYYSVIETPNEGDSIPALGEGANPKANPMKLKVCVRLTPEAKDADYASKLVIESNDTSNTQANVVLNVKWEEDNKYTVTCASADGKIKYDFTGINAGVAERCCNIFNEGPSGFLVNQVEVNALTSAKQDLAEKLYAVNIYATNANGDPESVKLPRSISPNKSLKFCVEYTYPSDGATTNGETVIRFTQANQPDALQIPVVAGTCDTPDLVLGPGASPIWMDATVGTKTSREVVVANQSCAPLQIIQACVSQVAGGASPCDAKTLSQHFFVDPEVGLTPVDAWGLLPIKVRFEPANNKFTNVQNYLQVVYCGGTWDGSACSEAPTTATVNLIGYIGSDRKLPELSLALAAGSSPKVGQPFKIEAAATDGDWPVGLYGAYVWFISSRPAGSTLWLSTEFQATDTPWLALKPDVAGKYRIVGAVQAVNDNNPGEFSWSQQVAIEVDVAP